MSSIAASVEQLIALFLATKNFSPLLHCATIRPSASRMAFWIDGHAVMSKLS